MKNKGIILSYVMYKDKDAEREICLDNELDISFCEGELKIKTRDNYIENFYGKNINNLSLIIGKNGVGKTTLINKIIDWTHSTYTAKDGSELIIKIVRKNSEIFIFYQEGMELSVKCFGQKSKINLQEMNMKEVDINSYHDNNFYNEDTGYHSIFFSNQYSYSSYLGSTQLTLHQPYNIGLMHLLTFPEKMFNEGNSNKRDSIKLYESYIYYTIANLFDTPVGERILNDFKIQPPDKFRIGVNKNEINKALTDISKGYSEAKKDIFIDIDDKANQNIFSIITILITYSILIRISHLVYNGSDYLYNKNIDIKTILQHKIIEKFIEFCENGVLNKKAQVLEYIKSLKEIIEGQDGFKEVVDIRHSKIYYEESFKEYIELINVFDKHNSLVSVENCNIIIDLSNKDLLKEAIYLSSVCIEGYNEILKFDFLNKFSSTIHFSSGQECILSMFAKFQDAFRKITKMSKKELDFDISKNCKSLILFLDEPDINLHPEWRRRFMSSLVNFIEMQFNNISVQVVLTTNSPILAGDILAKDIISLSNEIESNRINTETFSKNLMLLFKDTFFMDSLMSDFSKKTIKRLIIDIKEDKDVEKCRFTKEEQIKLINMIAEPALKGKILSLYKQKNSNESVSEDEIKIIKKAFKMNLSVDDISKLIDKPIGVISQYID